MREREEVNSRRKEEWEALNDNTKFFRTCEDSTKEPAVRFINLEAVAEDELPKNVAELSL